MSGLQRDEIITGIPGAIQEDINKKLSNCPYNCIQGKVFIPALNSFDDCPHCSEVYKSIASGKVKDDNGKDIYKILSIPSRYRNIEFDKENVFPKSVIEQTSQQSRNEIVDSLESINNSFIIGNKLENDYLFYLGTETDILKFVFPALRNAYAGKLKVVPYANTLELIQLYKALEEPVNSEYKIGRELEKELGVTYMDYCRSDVCIVSLTPVAGSSSVNMLYTLLKARRKRDLATIVFSETTGSSRELGYILNSDNFIKKFIDVREKVQQRPVRDRQQYISEPKQIELELPSANKDYGLADFKEGNTRESTLNERQQRLKNKF